MRFCAENCHPYSVALLYKQSIELSGSNPNGVFFPGRHEGGSMEFEVGSTFSESSIRSAEPSQFIWNRVTRGFDAKMFLWSWKKDETKTIRSLCSIIVTIVLKVSEVKL